MKLETKIQLEQRLKNDARQRIKDRINENMDIQIKHFQKKTKQEMKKVLAIYTQLINKNILTFNTMYLIIRLKSTLIHYISLTPKSKNSMTLKTVQTTKQCGK